MTITNFPIDDKSMRSLGSVASSSTENITDTEAKKTKKAEVKTSQMAGRTVKKKTGKTAEEKVAGTTMKQASFTRTASSRVFNLSRGGRGDVSSGIAVDHRIASVAQRQRFATTQRKGGPIRKFDFPTLKEMTDRKQFMAQIARTDTYFKALASKFPNDRFLKDCSEKISHAQEAIQNFQNELAKCVGDKKERYDQKLENLAKLFSSPLFHTYSKTILDVAGQMRKWGAAKGNYGNEPDKLTENDPEKKGLDDYLYTFMQEGTRAPLFLSQLIKEAEEQRVPVGSLKDALYIVKQEVEENNRTAGARPHEQLETMHGVQTGLLAKNDQLKTQINQLAKAFPRDSTIKDMKKTVENATETVENFLSDFAGVLAMTTQDEKGELKQLAGLYLKQFPEFSKAVRLLSDSAKIIATTPKYNKKLGGADQNAALGYREKLAEHGPFLKNLMMSSPDIPKLDQAAKRVEGNLPSALKIPAALSSQIELETQLNQLSRETKLSSQEFRAKALGLADRLADQIIILKREGIPSDRPLTQVGGGNTKSLEELKLQLMTHPSMSPDLLEGIDLRIDTAQKLTAVLDQKDLSIASQNVMATLCQKFNFSAVDAVQAGQILGVDPEKAKLLLLNRVADYLKGDPTMDSVREGHLLGIPPEQAKLKMLKRLVLYLKAGIDPKTHSLALTRRAEETGYSHSTIKAIEKAFARGLRGGVQRIEVEEGMMGMVAVDKTAHARKAEIILEEQEIGRGGFKAVRLATDFFALKKPSERGQYVSLKPKELEPIQKPKPTTPQTEPAEGIVVEINETLPAGPAEEIPEAGSDSAVVIPGAKENRFDSKGNIIKPEAEETGAEGIGFDSAVVIPGAEENRFDSKGNIIKPGAEPGPPSPSTAKKSEPQEKIPFNEMSLKEMKKELENVKDPGEKSKLEGLIAQRERDIQISNNYKLPTEMEEYHTEIDRLKELQGPGVVKIHSVVEINSGQKVMIQEAAGYSIRVTDEKGDLKEEKVIDLSKMEKLRLAGQLTPEQEVHFMQMASDALVGLERVQEKGYIYRDLKAENILVTADGKGKLADFGTVCKEKDDPAKAAFHGSAANASPELAKLASNVPGETEHWNAVTKKNDSWAAGIMLFELFLSKSDPALVKEPHPAHGPARVSPFLLLTRLSQMSKPALKKAYENAYPKPADEASLERLIWDCTRVNPEERPTIKEVHQRFQAIIDKKQAMLKANKK